MAGIKLKQKLWSILKTDLFPEAELDSRNTNQETIIKKTWVKCWPHWSQQFYCRLLQLAQWNYFRMWHFVESSELKQTLGKSSQRWQKLQPQVQSGRGNKDGVNFLPLGHCSCIPPHTPFPNSHCLTNQSCWISPGRVWNTHLRAQVGSTPDHPKLNWQTRAGLPCSS